MRQPLTGNDRPIDVALLLDLVATVAVAAISAIDRAVALLEKVWQGSRRRTDALCPHELVGESPPASLPSDEWYDLLDIFEERIGSAPQEEQHTTTRRLLTTAAAFFLSELAFLGSASAAPRTASGHPADIDDQRRKVASALDDAVEKADNATTVLLQCSRSTDPTGFLQAALSRTARSSPMQREDRKYSETAAKDWAAPGHVRWWLSHRDDSWTHPMPPPQPDRHLVSIFRRLFDGDPGREPLFEVAQRDLAETRSQLADTLGFLMDQTLPTAGSFRSGQSLRGMPETDFMLFPGGPVVQCKRLVAMVSPGVLPSLADAATVQRMALAVTAVECCSGAVVMPQVAPRDRMAFERWLAGGTIGTSAYHQPVGKTWYRVGTAAVPVRPILVFWDQAKLLSHPQSHEAIPLSVAADSGAPSVTADKLVDLADEMSRQGRLQAAIACYSSARARFREIHDPAGERGALLGSAEALRRLGKEDEATRSVKEANKLADEIKERGLALRVP